MKRFRCLSVAIFLIVVCSLLPLASTDAVQADSVKGNLKELTDAADSVLVGTVTDRSSYWNDKHTQIYTSVVFSVEDRLKGEAGPDKITITVPGGEVEGIGEFVSEMPSFDQGEKAVVFLKKLNNAQPPKAMSLPDKFPAQQFEVYQGFRGKFPIKGDRAGGLPVAEFKGRINSILSGQALPATELDITPSLVTMPYLYAGYSWPHPPAPVVPYRIHENASSCTGEGAVVQNAAATWSSAGANFSFSYAGTTAATAYGYDSVNEIMWVNTLDTGILAVAYIFYSGSTILENDVEFNNNYNWSTSPTCLGGYYDVQSVGLHEFGHWLCLDDLYDPADAAKVMYGYTSSGTTKRALTADDIAGIQSIYGTSSSNGTQKLIGADDQTQDGYGGGGIVNLQRFQAVQSGTMTEFKFKTTTSKEFKVAVYSDSGGSPDALLESKTETVTAGFATISGWSVPITSGAYYWLAICIAPDANVGYKLSGGARKYRAATYSTWTWPNPWTAAVTSDAILVICAGWGSTAAPIPPEPPTLLSPGTAITFKWGAATGATKYWLQVNTQSDFLGTNMFNEEVGDVTSYEVTGLSNGTTYHWRVKAGNNAGWSDWSSPTRSVLAN